MVCNIGDMLGAADQPCAALDDPQGGEPRRRSAAAWRATPMPFFLHFRPDFRIETLAAGVTPERPDRYPEPITADAYLHQRLREIGLS